MKKHLAPILVLAALTLAAQSHPPTPTGAPSNTYTNNIALSGTDSQGTFTGCVCLETIHSNGTVSCDPIAGVSLTFDSYTTQYSGYHSHETSLNSSRPQLYVASSIVQSSDSTGCAYWAVEGAGVAGWYTMEFTPAVTRVNGSPVMFANRGLNAYFFDQYSGTLFVPYPDNPSINVSQGLDWDASHNGYSRYFGAPIVTALTGASTKFIADEAKIYNVHGIQMEVYRGSLPHGGVADNQDYLHGAGQWFYSVEALEEHAHGTEADIRNIFSADPNSNYLVWYNLEIKEMGLSGCYLGTLEPGTSTPLSNPAGFWSGSVFSHYSCDHAPSLQRKNPR